MKKQLLHFTFLVLITLLIGSCRTTALYDQYSYRSTVSLKVDALHLMQKATEDYSSHAPEVEEVLKDAQKLYEYEKGREKNTFTIKMWEVMLNKDKNLLTGFMNKWKQDTTLSEFLVTESSKQVERGFDLIIGLEMEKIKEEDISNFLK